ncbi:MAG: hypothetical protein EOP06_16485 [Proteobacteria bacterium]|nr:MAG: hypothetical protein EOP06_16485 [Pseudomonadota bacterium]
MKVSEQFKDQRLNYLESYLPQEIFQNPDFKNSVLTSFDELIDLATLEVCEARKKGLGLSCDARDLAERTLRLANGNEIIAGARFKNLNLEFPFIEIQLASEISAELLSEISAAVRAEFKNLRPLGLKFKDKPNTHLRFERWSHTVFGKIEKHEPLRIPSGMDFAFSENLDWHKQYVAEYQARLAEKKELDGFVRIGQLDEFKESADDHALLVANDANGFCGVIAGIKSPIYGLPSVYMIESYLSKRWTGKKIAPVAHAMFLKEMSKRFEYVWGTIYDRNLSSLNTALRIGRRIIETEYFVRFDS